MYKLVFQNSKIALAFAVLTILSAVAMIGTSEDAGVVTRATDLVAMQRQSDAGDAAAYADGESTEAPPSEASVFGDYTASDQADLQEPLK